MFDRVRIVGVERLVATQYLEAIDAGIAHVADEHGLSGDRSKSSA